MLILNLSVAAVIEGLDKARNENLGLIDADSIVEMIELWRDYDPNATGWITVDNLIFVLCQLQAPLGEPQVYDKFKQDIAEDNSGGVDSKDRYLIN